MSRVLRIIIGLPFVIIFWTVSLFFACFVWGVGSIYDFCLHNHLSVSWIDWYNDSTTISPYQFLKKVWE